MAGLGAKDILRNITALEQLIEEINFQRAKEMRQCLMAKDTETGFVVVQGTTYWTDLFVHHFLFQSERSTDADDLLFFIRKKHIRGSRYISKYQTEVEVYRKDSRKLPIGDPDIDWEETVYLNLIIHQFDYTVTLAVCTRTSPKELQVLKRHSQKVYASPSRRRMDTKGEVEEITYPNVCFHVDNFDEIFDDMLVRDGEMVCVELVASDHAGSRQAVIFLGSIRYDALRRVYDARASISSKMAQRMMLGLFSGTSTHRIEFVRMRGPQGKGHAEMAVTKPKGSGVETPTSEPGISLTDMWDSDWEDEPEDRILFRHQRRLSDPSSNFNTFVNAGWKSRSEGARSRSENEGLDLFADGLYEIESGDVRDAKCSGRCCSVIACRTPQDDLEEEGVEFSTQYMCTKCQHFHGKQPIMVEVPCHNSEDEEDMPFLPHTNEDYSRNKHNKIVSHCELATRPPGSTTSSPSSVKGKPGGAEGSDDILNPVDEKSEGKSDIESSLTPDMRSMSNLKSSPGLLLTTETVPKFKMKPGSAVRVANSKIKVKLDKGEQDVACSGHSLTDARNFSSSGSVKKMGFQRSYSEELRKCSEVELSRNSVSLGRISQVPPGRSKKKKKIIVPYIFTPDGTRVNFLCDTKLDDGTYNPLWAMKGFTQTFHFWKESRRAQSVPLNAYLTYITLPWFTIITDILDHQTSPILTF